MPWRPGSWHLSLCFSENVRRSSLIALMSALIMTGTGSAADHEPPAGTIAVIVGSGSLVKNVTKVSLREIYLRRQRLWPDGTGVIPVNLPPTDPVRDEFSKLVLGRATHDMVAYWNGRYFEGITPPQVLPSAAAIRRFLEVEPGAIAYVPIAEVGDGCRTLLVLDLPTAGLPDPDASSRE